MLETSKQLGRREIASDCHGKVIPNVDGMRKGKRPKVQVHFLGPMNVGMEELGPSKGGNGLDRTLCHTILVVGAHS